ncbi:hypothetical protein KDX26_16145 [Burkholderia cenocepacia]|uniref:hypothetical protein n=1 Tax=Burkholderia cenocepacia TaxID=95486 RepID=UPI000CFEB487|nr:hypothetical protein [Burkholderia cenocepacia]MBR8383922.1 hypothetical protein [Burkholderia cenocepacia]MBR8434913.1 hypothetical protein [Burkholderia cenocepacia]PRG95818.1 hypothetical protein C6V04_07135 [Burkholderia multivorans]
MREYIFECGVVTVALAFAFFSLRSRLARRAIVAICANASHQHRLPRNLSFLEMVFHPRHWHRWTSSQWLEYCRRIPASDVGEVDSLR